MTPKGFKQWVSKAARGRQIIYFEGMHLQGSEATLALRDMAYAAYEAGEVILFQKRMTPAQGVHPKRTLGTFAYIALKL
jgi:hypothetical protein